MITIFGSINIDLVFAVERLPAPGETVTTGSYAWVPGGKGANQALAAARAGARVRMVGGVGRDGFAEAALAALGDGGVDLSAVAARDTATGCASIVVDAAGENTIVVASGANLETEAGQLAGAPLGAGDLLLLQMEVPQAENWAAAALARRAGARVLLNNAPAGALGAEALSALDILIMNREEAGQTAGHLGLPAADASSAARAIAERHGVVAIVTLGAAGAEAFGPEGHLSVGSPSVEVVDTTAAGDAFVGALAAALDGGRDLSGALARGAAAGALACRVAGAQPSLPAKAEIERHARALTPKRQ